MKKTGLFVLIFISSISGIFANNYYVSPARTCELAVCSGQGVLMSVLWFHVAEPDGDT